MNRPEPRPPHDTDIPLKSNPLQKLLLDGQRLMSNIFLLPKKGLRMGMELGM